MGVARRGPRPREISDLAQDLLRGRGEEPGGREGVDGGAAWNQWGRAVVLVGAGCSQSAGIPLASGVARRAVTHLARRYEPNSAPEDAGEALEALISTGRIPARYGAEAGGPHWAQLYTYVFSEHIKHPVEQRRFIGSMIPRDGLNLNWAHVCLGGLVRERFVHTILTTNFDQLALQGVIRTGIVPVVADGLESLNRISPIPEWPQVVHLHGSMHTYELRNSQTALSETEQDRGLQVMMMSILREATVLVVIGYAGGEEGIMALLRHAAQALPRMVVYWIAHEDDYSRFSPQARSLLEMGENKFFISGQDADDFFNALIGEVNIGAPRWIREPLQVLSSQARITADDTLPWSDVKRLVESYQGRVRLVVENHAPKVDHAEQATLLMSSRRFREAALEIEQVAGYREDPDLLRIHARSMHRHYDKSAEPDPADLGTAIDDLERLLLLENGGFARDVVLLIEAYRDKLEASSTTAEERSGIPELIGAAAGECRRRLHRDADRAVWSLMRFYEAEAVQLDSQLRDPSTDERVHDDAARAARLSEARNSYSEALPGLIASDAIKARECKEGLAGALTGLAELLGTQFEKEQCLREAQTLFREVMDFARVNTPDDRYAGAMENLVGVLRTSRRILGDQAPAARQEEERLLALALAIYEEYDESGVTRVREALHGEARGS